MEASNGQILKHYNEQVACGALEFDQAQLAAVTALDELAAKLECERSDYLRPELVQGIYLYGPVGRGKSMLMDVFYERVAITKKTRLHFHHFIAQVHNRLTALQGVKNPLDKIAREWANALRLMCFDEFYVSDIGDAMIMARLFSALFEHGVVLVATSNSEPENLYRNGLQRARFLPTIELLNTHCHVINVAGHIDHRFRFGQKTTHYFNHVTHNATIQAHFAAFSPHYKEHTDVLIHGRTLNCLKLSNHAIMFDFMALCSGPRSTADYIYLATHYQRVYVCNIPIMGAVATGKRIVHGIEDSYQREDQDLQEHTLDDEARRFIALVDEFYDRTKLLVLSACADIADLYQGQKLAFEYARTESRLIEMQNWD